MEEEETLEEYKNRKDILKSTLMDSKEQKEAEKFVTWYRKAHEDKSNRGLFSRWEEIERYWEGTPDEPLDEEDPCSNTNITNTNVEGKVALLVEQNLAVQVDPIEPSDNPFCERVRILADFIRDKNKMFRKIDIHERRREKFGTGIFRVLWDFDAIDELGLPIIDIINPAYFFVDPAITDPYKLQQARYVIEVESKSIYSARLKYGDDVAEAIIPNYDPVQNTFMPEQGEIDDEVYLHMYIYTRYRDDAGDTKLRLVEMTGDGLILSDTKKKLEEQNKKVKKDKKSKEKSDKEDEDEIRIFPNDKYPYFVTPDMYREGSFWGKASAELIIPVSDAIDELDNQILANARLVGNPIRLVAANSGIDVEKITNEPGLMIPTNDINGTRWENPPTMPQYILNKRQELMTQDRQIVTRFSDQQIGYRVKGIDTATESLNLQQNGNTAIDYKKGLLQETLSEVFGYAIELALLNWDTDIMFRITGENGEESFESFNPASLNEIPLLIESDTEYRDKYKENWLKNNKGKKEEDLDPEEYKYMQVGDETRKIKYDLKVAVGAGLPANKAFRYNVMSESYSKGALTKKEYRSYLIKNLGLSIPEVPDTIEEQQQIGVYSEDTIKQMQQAQQTGMGSETMGLNANGNVSINQVKGGLGNGIK